MDEGKISGFGTHEELMKTNAIYQEVYNSQIKGGGDLMRIEEVSRHEQ